MNPPATASAAINLPALGPANEFCAVLVLDATGGVTAANASARQLWQAAESELIGTRFPALFNFELTSTETDFIDAQWEVLLATASETFTPLQPRTRDGGPRAVRVRIEPALGHHGHYLATVQSMPPKATGGTADETHASFKLLAERSGVGLFELNLKSRRVVFSPAWKRLLGYTASELADSIETWQRLIHPDDSGAAPHRLAKKAGGHTQFAAVNPRPFNVEFRMRHRQGHWCWIQCVGVQLLDDLGEIEQVVGLHLDITERKELEDTLITNDARLQDLSNSGPLAAFELDLAHDTFWYSPAFARLLGYTEDEMPATLDSFATVLPAAEASAGIEAWLMARAPGEASFVEPVQLRAKDGRAVPVLFGGQRSVTRKRELTRVVGFVCPLRPDLIIDERALPPALTEEAFSTLAESVLVTDARGRVIFANATAVRLLQTEREAVRGQPIGDVFRLIDRQSLRPAEDPVDRALSADTPMPLIGSDALQPAADGTAAVPIVWTARAVYGESRKAVGVVIVFRNPDEMTLTPEELVKANRFESLGLLAGGIAHDFNNLLTTILGAISLAKDNRDYSSLGDAEKACMAAKGLTKQLLSFAKGGVGSLSVHSAKEILEDSIKIAAAATTTDITLTVAEDTAPVHVDRAQVLQVFQNLIVNALQAMPPKPHEARIQLQARNVVLTENQVPSLSAGDYVEFEVRDNGAGIQPEHVGKIFDPFFTTKKHGTGLGLATVLSMVRKHGGQIGLDTQPGVGTAFTVYLPKADAALEVQARRAPTLRFGTGRILFMDDDPKISSLTATMLESLDYKCDLARNGEEAMALYKRYLNIGRPYDLVIMDLTVVGGMGGEECFYELRKLDPDVRAIVATGYDNEDMNRHYLAKGFLGYLTKPYRVTDLGKRVKEVIG